MSQNFVGSLIKEMTLPMNGRTNGGPGRERFFIRYAICSKKRKKVMREMRYGVMDANVSSIFFTEWDERERESGIVLKQRKVKVKELTSKFKFKRLGKQDWRREQTAKTRRSEAAI